MQPKLAMHIHAHSDGNKTIIGIESVDNYIYAYEGDWPASMSSAKDVHLTGKEFRIFPMDAIDRVDQNGRLYYHPMFNTVWEWFRNTAAGQHAPSMKDYSFLTCGRGFTCLKGYIDLTLKKLEHGQAVFWPRAEESLHYSVIEILLDLGRVIIAASTLTSIEELCVHNDEKIRKLAQVRIKLQDQKVG